MRDPNPNVRILQDVWDFGSKFRSVLTETLSRAVGFYLPIECCTVRFSRIFLRINKNIYFYGNLRRSNLYFMVFKGNHALKTLCLFTFRAWRNINLFQGRQNVFESGGAKVCETVFAPQGSSSVP